MVHSERFLLPCLSSSVVGAGSREKEVDVCSHPTMVGGGAVPLFIAHHSCSILREQTQGDLLGGR